MRSSFKVWLIIIPILAVLLIPGRPSTVVLTFDVELHDSPEQVYQVLDILATYNASATFFVLGEFYVRYPEVIERIKADGHELGYHSYNHPVLTDLNPARKLAQLEPPTTEIKGFRAPWNRMDEEGLRMLKFYGYEYDASLYDFFTTKTNRALPVIYASSYFGLPLQDYVFFSLVKAPSLYPFFVNRIKSDQLVLIFHPHILLTSESTFHGMMSRFTSLNVSFRRCIDVI